MPVARIPSGHHTVKHIHTAAHTFQADQRECPRPSNNEGLSWVRSLAKPSSTLIISDFRLAHRQATDRIAIESRYAVRPSSDCLRKSRVHAALDDTEQRRGVIGVSTLAALRPAQRAAASSHGLLTRLQGKACTHRRSSQCRYPNHAECALRSLGREIRHHHSQAT